VTISRAAGTLTFQAANLLVSALNPCPCGFYGDLNRECRCNPGQIERYRQKISGPLLDRIDLHIEVPLIEYKDLASKEIGENSATVRERVVRCRSMMLEQAMSQLNFSARAHDRILKVARTIADLAGAEELATEHVLEAIQYRSLDRKLSF